MNTACAIAPALLISTLTCGCQLGSEQAPGCRVGHPEDCESGWTCREGTCFKPTTPLSPPVDDAGLEADAGALDALVQETGAGGSDGALDVAQALDVDVGADGARD